VFFPDCETKTKTRRLPSRKGSSKRLLCSCISSIWLQREIFWLSERYKYIYRSKL